MNPENAVNILELLIKLVPLIKDEDLKKFNDVKNKIVEILQSEVM